MNRHYKAILGKQNSQIFVFANGYSLKICPNRWWPLPGLVVPQVTSHPAAEFPTFETVEKGAHFRGSEIHRLGVVKTNWWKDIQIQTARNCANIRPFSLREGNKKSEGKGFFDIKNECTQWGAGTALWKGLSHLTRYKLIRIQGVPVRMVNELEIDLAWASSIASFTIICKFACLFFSIYWWYDFWESWFAIGFHDDAIRVW